MQMAFISLESPLPGILSSVAVNSDPIPALTQRQEPLSAEISYFCGISFMCVLGFQFFKNFRTKDLSGK